MYRNEGSGVGQQSRYGVTPRPDSSPFRMTFCVRPFQPLARDSIDHWVKIFRHCTKRRRKQENAGPSKLRAAWKTRKTSRLYIGWSSWTQASVAVAPGREVAWPYCYPGVDMDALAAGTPIHEKESNRLSRPGLSQICKCCLHPGMNGFVPGDVEILI